MIKRFALAAIATTLLPTMAFAFWDVQKSDEDVFGNINVTATSLGDNGSMVRFECGSGKEPFVAFLLRDNSGAIDSVPATLLMKGDDGKIVKATAELGSWNEKFVAVRTEDKAFLNNLAEVMVTTSKSIPIGAEIEVLGIQVSDTFSSQGSTAAGNAVKEGCLKTE